jgi:chromosome segregation protein
MLKSLELNGFKSFADRTRFDFHSGITAIVGPNGSGKSNVVDAIKWILGDQSAKSLRGKEMTDVIFNGAAGRKGAGLAEATLTIDNSSGFLPSQFQEVQIGRRIWHNGDAEYLINGATARLKDVRELLMGTGTGSTTYAIIEQGQVDQILQANATNRRRVFEEAAGISRYKARKTEAERRLERVEQNLLRLTDIVDEVEAQRNSTRSQAAKAAKYREVSQELRELWLGLAADDHRHLSENCERIEKIVTDSEARVAALNEQLAQTEHRIAALDVEIAEVDDRLRDVERLASVNRETIAGHEATVHHQAARQRELASEIGRLRKQKSILAARANEGVVEREHNKQVLGQLEDDFTRLQKEFSTREEQIRQLTDQLEKDRQAIEEAKQQRLDRRQQVSAEEKRMTALESQQTTAEESRRDSQRRSDELDELIAERSKECQHRGLHVGEAAEQTSHAKQELRRLQDLRESLLSEHMQFQRALAEQRERRSGWQARKGVLEDLENRQEGLGIGVKEILGRSKTSDYPPWNSILGSVADLITVDLEHAALLDVAIGTRSQLIVVEDYQPLVEYLSNGAYHISGRVGFIVPHSGGGDRKTSNKRKTTRKPASSSEGIFDHLCVDVDSLPDLSEHAGVVGRADRLIRSSPQAAGLAERLLADTWIVDTLEVAVELSAGEGHRCRFVTRQGELLEADGTIVVGTVRSESAIVSRKSELRSLKTDLLRLERRISKEEKRLAGLDDSLAEANSKLESAEAKHQQAVKLQSAREAEFAEGQRELQRLNRDRALLQAEAAQYAAQHQQIGQELDQVQLKLAAAEEDLRALETNNQQAERELARHTHRRQSLQQRRTAEQLDLAKSEERLGGMREAFTRLERDLDQRNQQQQESERRFQLVRSKAGQITLHILNTSAAVAELLLAGECSAENAAALLRQKQQLRSRRSETSQEENRVRQLRREQNDRRHQAEINLRDIRNQIQTLADRIDEEYQVDLDDVASSGVSAYERYLDEHQRKTEIDETAPSNVAEEGQAGEVGTIAEESAGGKERGDNPQYPDSSAAERGHASVASSTPLPAFADVRQELESRVNRLRRRLKLMGSVNTDSLQELDELEKRYGGLSEQLADLVEAKNALEDIIRRINAESTRMFSETFASIRGHFQDLFRRLFGGGEADVVLEDLNDVLECGIDVVARPPGKELRSISLLSGGEKTMTAVALQLAIFKSRPSPFCILDEVDAALDEANLGRFVSLLKEFRNTTQFIMITHRKPSMTVADVLYGVTMEQSGVSKRMTVRFEDVGEDGNFKAGFPDALGGASSQDGEISAAA